ncbi:MAG: hypothetical protein NVS3B7_10820 [Candidatus Elarobacter sp.]
MANANVSVPTGASITSVVDGKFRYCATPPFTVTETLRAVAGTYRGERWNDWADDAHRIVQVTLARPEVATGGGGWDRAGTVVPPPPPHPAQSAAARAAAASGVPRRKRRGIPKSELPIGVLLLKTHKMRRVRSPATTPAPSENGTVHGIRYRYH